MQTIKHRDGTAERRRELFQDAVGVIARDYAHDLHIDDVGRTIAASRRQLQRVFAEVGGTSFRELLQTTRMTEARRLLVQDGLRINQVAKAVGYHQPAQFTKAFRRELGMAPREFRNLANERLARPLAVVERPRHDVLRVLDHLSVVEDEDGDEALAS